ncbi:hypothetical protein WCLP8_3860004 [uncultured Gammaproteobacteria bacterium]
MIDYGESPMAAVAFTTSAHVCARPSPSRNADADASWAEVRLRLADSAAYVMVTFQLSADGRPGLAQRGDSRLNRRPGGRIPRSP